MKARPVKFSFRTLSDRELKKVALLLISILFALILVIAFFPLLDKTPQKHEATTYSMGSYVQQTVYGKAGEEATVQAADTVQALENRLSWKISNSDIKKLNDAAGKNWITLPPDTLEILAAAQDVAENSQGAFDITLAPISHLWDFENQRHTVPNSDQLNEMLQNVGYAFLRLDLESNTASLKYLANAVDLSAIEKGAACDAAIQVYEKAEVDAAIISVGSSVGVYGTKSSGAPWNIAIQDPNSENTLGALSIDSGFVSTSAIDERSFEQDGTLYHHLLDPRTGYPAENDLLSVTVVSDSGILSDALSYACFVLGIQDSTDLLAQYDAEALFVDKTGVITVTDGLKEAFELTADGYTMA